MPGAPVSGSSPQQVKRRPFRINGQTIVATSRQEAEWLAGLQGQRSTPAAPSGGGSGSTPAPGSQPWEQFPDPTGGPGVPAPATAAAPPTPALAPPPASIPAPAPLPPTPTLDALRAGVSPGSPSPAPFGLGAPPPQAPQALQDGGAQAPQPSPQGAPQLPQGGGGINPLQLLMMLGQQQQPDISRRWMGGAQAAWGPFSGGQMQPYNQQGQTLQAALGGGGMGRPGGGSPMAMGGRSPMGGGMRPQMGGGQPQGGMGMPPGGGQMNLLALLQMLGRGGM